MKKRIVLWAVAVMALGMGVCSCGGDDVEDVTPKEEAITRTGLVIEKDPVALS